MDNQWLALESKKRTLESIKLDLELVVAVRRDQILSVIQDTICPNNAMHEACIETMKATRVAVCAILDELLINVEHEEYILDQAQKAATALRGNVLSATVDTVFSWLKALGLMAIGAVAVYLSCAPKK